MIRMNILTGGLLMWSCVAGALAAEPKEARPITFNKNFEGASLGTIEKLSETTFRLHVEGQYDERGRNRQASWQYFRMDQVKGREVQLTFTDFVGEYNDKPGSCPMGPDIVPVYSYDGQNWRHFPGMDWDAQKKEITLKFTGEKDTIWIAHQPPYTWTQLKQLLEQVNRSPFARVEVIGHTVQGRELNLVTVTDLDKPDDQKKTVWLQARQHAWESGTSYVMEGALRFVTSDDPAAKALRERVVFKFTPMMDPDGSVNGKVRFNANGYDVNRHWAEVDLRSKELLTRMPEIWYVKKAILGYVDSGRKIDVMINLHNTETNEYMDTAATDEGMQAMMQKLFATLVETTTFDPSRKLGIRMSPGNDTCSLYGDRKIPVLLMEQRVGTGPKAKRRMTVADRLEFGKALIRIMGETVVGQAK
jgi:hypothetical protein